jgi:hypothetical protein
LVATPLSYMRLTTIPIHIFRSRNAMPGACQQFFHAPNDLRRRNLQHGCNSGDKMRTETDLWLYREAWPESGGSPTEQAMKTRLRQALGS